MPCALPCTELGQRDAGLQEHSEMFRVRHTNQDEGNCEGRTAEGVLVGKSPGAFLKVYKSQQMVPSLSGLISG